MEEKTWRPKVGDKVFYHRRHRVKGVVQGPRPAVVTSIYDRDDQYERFGIKLRGSLRIKAVFLGSLTPAE